MQTNTELSEECQKITDEIYDLEAKFGYINKSEPKKSSGPYIVTEDLCQALEQLNTLKKRWAEITGVEYQVRL